LISWLDLLKFDLLTPTPKNDKFKRDIFNCSNCDSSKKLLDAKIQLLDTIQADINNVTTGRTSKTICCTCIENHFQAVSLLDKKLMTAGVATGGQKF
jgi:hypothetical protein